MNRALLFIILTLSSCRNTTLSNEVLSEKDNELFCNGTKNMIVYLKQSQEIKDEYADFLHNKGTVGLRIDSEAFKGLPFGQHTKLTVDPTDIVAVKKLDYNCPTLSDSNPDFDVTFYFLPERKILSSTVTTILDKQGYRSGYLFEVILHDDGQLGEVRISIIQE